MDILNTITMIVMIVILITSLILITIVIINYIHFKEISLFPNGIITETLYKTLGVLIVVFIAISLINLIFRIIGVY